jgi:hypothetical protein
LNYRDARARTLLLHSFVFQFDFCQRCHKAPSILLCVPSFSLW